MKTVAILAIIGSASALGELAWTPCTSDADCGEYTCCSITKDG